MKVIDYRFSSETMKIFRAMINQEFKTIKHDPLIYGPGVYGIVGLYIGDRIYKITNQTEVLDYFGKMEDVAVFKFASAEAKEIKSYTNNKMISFPISSSIKEIHIINENQQLFYNGNQIYDVYTVRGIIFVLQDNRELSFEKSIWFSEDIYVEKGHDLYNKFSSTDSFLEDWDEGFTAQCKRDVVVVK